MLKKILPLLIAVSLILGLSAVTVFAAGDEMPSFNNGQGGTVEATGVNDGNGVVKIGKTLKLLNAGTTHPAETFYLVQTGKETAHSSVASDAAPDLDLVTDAGYSGTYRLVGKVPFGEGEVTTTTGTKKYIEIGLPEFTAVGIYTYTLAEVDSKTAGIQYWANPIKLIITVVENDDGKFYIEGIHCEKEFDPLNENGTKTDNFDNIYKANSVDPDDGGLRIEKEVTGNLGDRDKYFDFTVTFRAETGMNYATAPTVTVSPTSNTSNPTSLDFTGLSATNPITVTFKLKHGETIAFGNVPYGVTYAYTEANYSGEEYVTSYPQKNSGTDPDTGDAIMVDDKDGTINSVSVSYKVTNDKNRPIDTGVIVDSLPYVLALAAVMLCGVFFVIKRRRNADDLA